MIQLLNSINIIIMDYKENILKWLDSELAEITEITTKNACRTIELTYPYENEEITEETTLWYEQGNKIYIPEINGISSCLYVINTDYQIDFWKENTITVTAEEVLTELNFDVISFDSADALPVNLTNLREWFGGYYNVTGIDTLNTKHNKVSPKGVMTYMSLLRMIEEQTERTFITEYTVRGADINNPNKITRELYLANIENEHYISNTETLDLNYNLDSLEFIKSEEKTYNAMAPVFNESNTIDISDVGINTSSNVISTAQNNTSETGPSLLQDWLEYEVNEGETVPMIIEKDEQGNTVTTATWSAPFTKKSGELYIKYDGVTRANYTRIHSYDDTLKPDTLKVGTVSTSETLVEAVYNTLAVALLGKLQPTFELSIKVKDIQMLLGDNNLGYQLHESLLVKVPNFNYYVPCRITETVKNLHLPGENTIKLETEVASITELIDTNIAAHDVIISGFENNNRTGGVLLAEDVPLSEQMVTITVKLIKSYATSDEVTQQNYATFDPYNNTYTFNKDQIQNLEKAIRNNVIENEYFDQNEYRLRDAKGYVYSVPKLWCLAIYYAWIQMFYNDEKNKGLGNGVLDSSITVHYYPNAFDTINGLSFSESKKYYTSIFYQYVESSTAEFEENNMDWSIPFGVNCSPLAEVGGIASILSVLSALLKTFIPPKQLSDMVSLNSDYMAVLTNLKNKYGFRARILMFTEENLTSYMKTSHEPILLNLKRTALTNEYFNGVHSNDNTFDYFYVLVNGWIYIDDVLMCNVIENVVQIYNPQYRQFKPSMNNLVPFDVLFDSNSFYFNTSTNQLWRVDNAPINDSWMIIFENSEDNLANYEEVQQMLVSISQFDPSIKTYHFYINEVRNAIMEMIKTNSETIGISNMNTWTTLKTTDGTSYSNVSMFWLRAIAYAFMYYYRNHDEKSSNLSVDAGNSTDSMKYYNHFDVDSGEIGEYDWFSPCYPKSSNNVMGYICSTLLFNLGIPYSPYDFSSGSGYTSFDDIATQIKNKAGKVLGSDALHTFIVDATSVNIKKYLQKTDYDEFMYTVILTYAYDSSLNNTAYFSQTHYPVMLYSVDGNNVSLMNILANGNSPSNRYNVSISNSGNYNPYSSKNVTTLVNSITAASNSISGGDKNKMLVISWYTKDELGG